MMLRWLWIALLVGGARALPPIHQVTTAPGIDSNPAWSPDGSKIVFSSGRLGSNGLDLWVIPSEGGTAVQITNAISNEYGAHWSPDGSTIAFYWAWDADLCTVPATGGSITTLVGEEGAELHPEFSPDGNWIAFDSNTGGNTDIWIVPTAGGAAVRVTTSTAVDEDPSWSSDGERLVFVSDRGGDTQLWTIARTGGEAQPVGSFLAIQPSWRPGSEEVAYVSLPEYDIAVVGVDNGESVPATASGEGLDMYPAWSRDGGKLAFMRRVGNEGDVWVAEMGSVGVKRVSWSEFKRSFGGDPK